MFSSLKTNKTLPKKSASSRPILIVSPLVREACSVYIEKGRFHSTASKLLATKPKCQRICR